MDNIEARLQGGGREDWLVWARALGEGPDGEVTRMLLGDTEGQVGFALVSATKK